MIPLSHINGYGLTQIEFLTIIKFEKSRILWLYSEKKTDFSLALVLPPPKQ